MLASNLTLTSFKLLLTLLILPSTYSVVAYGDKSGSSGLFNKSLKSPENATVDNVDISALFLFKSFKLLAVIYSLSNYDFSNLLNAVSKLSPGAKNKLAFNKSEGS